MSKSELLAVCAERGYRVNNDAGTVSGVENGVAFRLTADTEQLELSVNLPEKRLPKLSQAWDARCSGITVAHGEGCRLVLTCPRVAEWSGEQVQAFLVAITADCVNDAAKAFTNRHEKERDPFFAYVRGFFGALLGALVGALPWFLVRQFAGWDMWYLLGLVGVASFYGYRTLWGAHSTRYAWVLIAAFSVLTVVLFSFGEQVWNVSLYREAYAEMTGNWSLLEASLWDIVRFCLTDAAIRSDTLSGLLWPLLLCAAGLVGIRRQITVYTHESAFLRRGKRRK